jgi:hypothetical protein
MALATGDILYVYFSQISRNKFVVCICPNNCYCFLINTDSRKTSPDAQVTIKKTEYPYLDYDSFINTASIVQILVEDMDKGKKLGILKVGARNEIKGIMGISKYLPSAHKEIVLSNFFPS